MLPIPPNETERLSALRDLRILGSAPEPHFDAVCRTACALFSVPVALVTLVDAETLWAKASCGIAAGTIPREGAFCSHTILSDAVVVAEDAARDARFSGSPLVTGAPHVRFYAGAPLILRPGVRVGSVCLLDFAPRRFSEAQSRQLQDLADMVVAHLRLHAANADKAREVADRQAAILAQLAEGVIVTDAEGRIVLVNEAAAAIHGVARLDVAPNDYSDTYHLYTEDGCPYVPQDLPLARAVRGETVTDARWRILRPDGSEVLAIGSARPLRGAGDERIGAVLTLRDDTAREAVERRLRESEARMRTLTDNMPSGAVVQLAVGADGNERRFLHLSRSYERMMGVPIEAVLADARIGYDPILPKHLAHLAEAEARSIRDGTPFEVEIEFRRGDTGEERWGRVIAAAPRTLPDGTLIWDGLLIDITEQKRTADALRELNATLAQRVAARTQEADAAREEAEAASRAKSDFLASMSHEIRTPLNGILGYTDLLLEHVALDLGLRRYGERIRSAGSALLTIVDDILDFSTVEAGRIALSPEPLALDRLAEEAAAIVRPGAELKGLSLRVEAGSALPPFVLGDRDRLRQVLLNLLNNAVKFTAHGGVTLTIDATVAEGAARLRFAVRDTGIGIPAAKQHLLFERFSQIDGTIRREFGGTGLGLAISKRLVELMGGTIGLDSEAGRGATFWFALTLPLAAGAPASAPASAQPPPRGRRRLLLVEDVVLNQELARTVLTRAGHAVDVVSGGPEAIIAVQSKSYDLVLMDIQMPGMDGITATRLIRDLDHPAAAVPIVAMTANVLGPQIASYREAGMQDHVGKPFERAALLATIERWALPGGAAPVEAETPGLDRDAFDGMVAVLGRSAIDRLLLTLADELVGRLGPEGTIPDRDSLADGAHAMISATGMLGFTELAKLCRAVESACRAGDDYRALLARLHAQRRLAFGQIETLRAA